MSKFKDELCTQLFSEINQLVQGIEDKPFYENEFEQLEAMFQTSPLSPYFGKWLKEYKDGYFSIIEDGKKRILEDKKKKG